MDGGERDKSRPIAGNAFQVLKQWRGVAGRYAENTASFLAASHIRCMAIWTKIKRRHTQPLPFSIITRIMRNLNQGRAESHIHKLVDIPSII